MQKRARLLSAFALFGSLNGCAYLSLESVNLESAQPEQVADTASSSPNSESRSPNATAKPGGIHSPSLFSAISEPSLKEVAQELGTLVDDEALPIDQDASDNAASEPAIASAADPDDLWQLTRDHFGFDLEVDNPRIDAQLNWYAKHPRYLHRVATRANRYYYHVLQETVRRGMPAEIALLPIVESAFDPFAYSHGRAAGPWQFIPGTAKHFGLKKSWWYDGRRDLLDSTDAALDYLTQLSARFDGDWLLALASYNAGAGNVSKAIKRNKRKGKPTDFWSLDLPRETEAYVPKLIALAKLLRAPEAYGLELPPIPNRPYFTVVDTHSQIDLAQAADLAGIETNELYLLNPGFNQWATDPEGPHRLLIPVDSAEDFRQALEQLPASERVAWKRYKVKSGDSLIVIAKRFKTTTKIVQEVNGLRGSNIRAGQALMIPTASRDAHLYTLSAPQRQASKSRRLALRSGKQKLDYKVREGDSFWTIARRFGVGTRELASWNQMAPGDPLRIGKELTVWLPENSAKRAVGADRNVIRKVGYRVRSGDSLARIAGRFNVKVSDIRKWNSKAAQAKYLKPGQQLTLYVDVTQSR